MSPGLSNHLKNCPRRDETHTTHTSHLILILISPLVSLSLFFLSLVLFVLLILLIVIVVVVVGRGGWSSSSGSYRFVSLMYLTAWYNQAQWKKVYLPAGAGAGAWAACAAGNT
jgi:hypothetical protein